MIISESIEADLTDFRLLIKNTDIYLNNEAKIKQDYFSKRSGIELEFDVFDALKACSENTPFKDSIQLVSGASFPDIIARGYYGIEVKSTNKDKWTSIGSSILESTRNPNVKRVFLTFGKLGKPVQFKSRPYEECLSGISVTHYPRYQINMELKSGETIFDKIGVSYNKLREMDNPITPVSKYYRSILKPGQCLWWASDNTPEENSAPPIIRLWNTLSPEEKNYYTVLGYSFFPEILGDSTKKYQKYALWLATHCSIVNTNIRDQFSAGGKVTIKTYKNTYNQVPAAYGRINKNAHLIIDAINNTDKQTLQENWKVSSVSNNRINQWCVIVSKYTGNPQFFYKMLSEIFTL